MSQALKTFHIVFNDPFRLGDAGEIHNFYILHPSFEAAVGWVGSTFPGVNVQTLLDEAAANAQARADGREIERKIGNQRPVSVTDTDLYSKLSWVDGKRVARPSEPGENARELQSILESWQDEISALQADFQTLIKVRNYRQVRALDANSPNCLDRAKRANQDAAKCLRWIEGLSQEWVRQEAVQVLNWVAQELPE